MKFPAPLLGALKNAILNRIEKFGYTVLRNEEIELARKKQQEMSDLRHTAIGEMNAAIDERDALKEQIKQSNIYDEAYFILLKFIHDQLDEIESNATILSPPGKKQLVVSIVLWGEKYTNLFLKYFIPSVLSPGNFPAVAQKRDICLDLYLPVTDWETVQNSEFFAALK